MGRTIGKYEIHGVLGTGAMGVVFRGWDPRLGRDVAIKTMYPHLCVGREARARFLREARAMAMLVHPNIVRVFDLAEENGAPFITMEFLPGADLHHLLRTGGPLPPHLATGILRQVAAGLLHAHRNGVIHRDVKPANVILLSDGRVKVVDFGIARLLSGAIQTRTGATLGTPAYMSPEQALGHRVDHRCDQFAVGVIAYESLTGHNPFQLDTYAASLQRVLNHQPAALDTLRPDCPEWLYRTVDRLLQKEPDQRFPDMAAVIEALSPAGDGNSTPPPAPLPPEWNRLVGERLADLGRLDATWTQFPNLTTVPTPASPSSPPWRDPAEPVTPAPDGAMATPAPPSTSIPASRGQAARPRRLWRPARWNSLSFLSLLGLLLLAVGFGWWSGRLAGTRHHPSPPPAQQEDRLRAQIARDLLLEVRQALEADDLVAAEARLTAAESVGPTGLNAEIASLRLDIQTANEHKAVQARQVRAAELVQRARELLRAGQVDEAERALWKAEDLGLPPASPDLTALRTQVAKRRANLGAAERRALLARTARQLLQDVESSLDSGELDQAKRLLARVRGLQAPGVGRRLAELTNRLALARQHREEEHQTRQAIERAVRPTPQPTPPSRVPALPADESPPPTGTLTEIALLNKQAANEDLAQAGPPPPFTNGLGMTFAWVRAGEADLGSDDTFNESPRRRVRLSRGFYLQVTEVTQGQWVAVMGTRPWRSVTYVPDDDEYPVVHVSWREATDFLERLSARDGHRYRLPTEAEWEYACRPTGAGGPSGAWVRENTVLQGRPGAQAVGRLNPNRLGLHDLLGNVWEWCADWFDPTGYRQAPTLDPTGPASGTLRVIRGGSWEVPAAEVTPTRRAGLNPARPYYYVGFRSALNP